MSGINLVNFCEVQKAVWKELTSQLKDSSCKKCKEKKLNMVSKWKCKCENCGTLHTIKKPKQFPKNMNDKRNWKARCDECSGVMSFYENSHNMAYICNKCGNVLEV